MTRETAQKHREAFNAFCEGKTIQYRRPGSDNFGDWTDNDSPVWNADYEYRIKPREPREFWLVFNDEDLTDGPSGVYTVEQTGWRGKPLPNQIRVREILPDETP